MRTLAGAPHQWLPFLASASLLMSVWSFGCLMYAADAADAILFKPQCRAQCWRALLLQAWRPSPRIASCAGLDRCCCHPEDLHALVMALMLYQCAFASTDCHCPASLQVRCRHRERPSAVAGHCQ